MADLIKLRMKKGSVEIEIEGVPATVEATLEKWWPRISTAAESEDESLEVAGDPPARSERIKRKRPKRAPSDAVAKPRFDPTPIVNSMKQDERFSAWEEKILHEADRFKKVLLVCWFIAQPLTSGDVHKVLTALGVKTGLPDVSKALSANSGSFITTGQRERGGEPIRYTLTGKAKKDFEGWLQNGKPGN